MEINLVILGGFFFLFPWFGFISLVMSNQGNKLSTCSISESVNYLEVILGESYKRSKNRHLVSQNRVSSFPSSHIFLRTQNLSPICSRLCQRRLKIFSHTYPCCHKKILVFLHTGLFTFLCRCWEKQWILWRL